MTEAVHPTAASAAWRSARARGAVAAVFLLNGLILASWVSRIPAVRDDLRLSSEGIGLVLLAMSIGALLALPSTGMIVLRFGTARTVAFGATTCVSGLALAGLATGVPVLVAGLFLLGVGSSACDVAMNVEGAAVERASGRSVMPRLHASWSIGSVLGALIGVWSNLVGLATSVHLGAVAVLALTASVAACRWFLPPVEPDLPRRRPARRASWSAWREPRTIALGFLVLAFAFTEGSASDWLALGVIDGYDVHNAAGVLTFALFTTAMTIGRLGGTRMLDRFGRVRVLRSTAGLAMLGVVMVIVGPSVQVAMAGALLWGIGTSLGFPVGISAAAHDPAQAAVRVSVVASIGYLAFLAGPPLIGVLGKHIGVLSALWVVLGALALAILLAGHTRAPGQVPGQPARPQ